MLGIALPARATVPSSSAFLQYVLSTNPQTLPVTYVFQNAGDLYVLDSATSPPTVLVLNSDYSVSGGAGTTGSLTTIPGGTNGVQVGDTITILRGVPLTQTVNFTNTSPFNPAILTQALDKLTMITQQLNVQMGNALQFQPDEIKSGILGLNARKGNILAFDANGNITWIPTSVTPGGYVQQIVAGTNITISPLGGQGAVTINAASGATPGGPFTSVQFNNSGALGGSGLLEWNGSVLTTSGLQANGTSFLVGNVGIGFGAQSNRTLIVGGNYAAVGSYEAIAENGTFTAVGNNNEFESIAVGSSSINTATGLTGLTYNGIRIFTPNVFNTSGLAGGYMLNINAPAAGMQGAINVVSGAVNFGGLLTVGSTLTVTGTTTTLAELLTSATVSRAAINVGSLAGSPGTLNNGDLWYNATTNALDARINGATVALGAGGGGSGNANTLTVTQTQSFTLGECLYNTGVGWAASDNSTFTTAHVDGVVISPGSTSFTVILTGYQNAISGLAVDTQYYLGSSGALTSTAPSGLTAFVTTVLKTGVSGDGVVNIGSPGSNALMTVSGGGTGLSSVTANAIIIGNGTSPFTAYTNFDALTGSNVGIGATALAPDALIIGSALSNTGSMTALLMNGSLTTTTISGILSGVQLTESYSVPTSSNDQIIGLSVSGSITNTSGATTQYIGLSVAAPSVTGSNLSSGYLVKIFSPATGMNGSLQVQGASQFSGGMTNLGGITTDSETVNGTLSTVTALSVAASLTNAAGEVEVGITSTFNAAASGQNYAGMTVGGAFVGGAFTSSDLYGIEILTPTITSGSLAGGYQLNILAPATGMSGAINVVSGLSSFGGRVLTTSTSTLPALNVGSNAGPPSTLVNGDMWYDSTGHTLNARINGATVALGSGGGGGGTVTNTSGNLTSGSLVIGNGTVDVKTVVGLTSDGTSVVTLGVPGGSVGGLIFANATSGTIELLPTTGALSTTVLTMPAGNGTLARLSDVGVTSVATSAGVTGGTITSTGTISLDTTYAPTWTAAHIFQDNALGAATAQDVTIQNSTAAALGAQQWSPAIYFQGQGWGTTGGTSQAINYREYVTTVQSTVPTGTFVLESSVNGGAFANGITLTTAGVIQGTLSYTTSLSSGTAFSSNGNTAAAGGRNAFTGSNANAGVTAGVFAQLSNTSDAVEWFQGSSAYTGSVGGGSPIGGTAIYSALFTTTAKNLNFGVGNTTTALSLDGTTGLMFSKNIVRVTTPFTVTSSTALTNVTGLTFTLNAGASYQFRAWLPTTAATAGGIQFAMGGTCTATNIIYEGVLDFTGSLGQTRATSLGTVVGSSSTATTGTVEIDGTITVNAAGTLTVQFAQNTGNATGSVVLQGAYFEIQQTAN